MCGSSYIAQMVEHCSTKAKAMGLNPVSPEIVFLGLLTIA